ncbi:MAG: hypothetical protein ABI347_10655 [Nitrososphaera sp.]
MIRPDVIVVLGRDNKKLAASLVRRGGVGEGGPWLLLRARSADQATAAATAKTRQERVSRRAEQFARYVGEGKERVEKNLSSLAFVYCGRRLPKERALQLLGEGMFVGLGSKGVIAGFGIVEAASGDTIVIKTGVQNFTTVYLSEIGIKGDGAEFRLSLTL